MNDFGDLRSALHSGTEHILALPQPKHVWNYIKDHLEITPQTVKWEIWGENYPKSLRASSSEGWKLSIGSLVLATGLTFDLVKCSHEWSTVPALEVLPIWISWADGALKRGDITQETHDAPLVAIEAKKAWLHGKISVSGLKKARDAAYDAAAKGAGYGANGAAYAGYAANAAGYAANAAGYAASNAAYAANVAAANAYNSAWERYNEEFCQYVLDSIMKEHFFNISVDQSTHSFKTCPSN